MVSDPLLKYFILDYEKAKEELEETKLAIRNTHSSLSIFESVIRKKKRDMKEWRS